MIYILKPQHYKHFSKLGLKIPLGGFLSISDAEYAQHYIDWHHTLPEASKEELHIRVMAHVQTIRQHQHAAQPANHRTELRIIGMLLALLLILLLATRAHGQFSQITTITGTDGATTVSTAGPFKMSFSGCTVGGTGAAWTINCTGGAANPGGSAHQLQVNLNGTGFAGLANGTAGQVLCSNGTLADPAMCDPIVSGPDVVGAAPTKNPVQIGCLFLTTPATVTNNQVGAVQCDSTQNLLVKVSNFPAAFQANAGTNLNTSLLALEAGGNLAAIKTDVDKIPASPSTDRTTAVAPFSFELSDGAAFYTGTKTGQLPTALDGSGFLKTHEQGTAAISAASLPLPSGAATAAKQPALGTAGSASADVISIQGVTSMTPVKVDGSGVTQPVSGTVTVQQATGTNLHTVCDSGCSSSTAPADGSAFTESTTSFSPVGGYFRTSPTSLTTDHMGVVGMTATRHLFVNLPDALPAGSNVIGHVIADSGSTTVVTGNVAATVADGADVTLGAKADAKSAATDTTAVSMMQVLKEISAMAQAPASTPVTGTFFQSTQPVSCANGATCPTNATLQAGSAIVGKVGIDQTTPGTTNAVQETNLPATVDTNSGNKSASTIRVVMATDQPNLTTPLNVNCASGCTPGGSFADNSTFTPGSTAMSNSGGVYNDGLAPVTSGNGATARITGNRALHETPMSPSGIPLGTQSNPVYVASLAPIVPPTAKSQLVGAFGQPIGTPSSPVSVQLPPAPDPCSGGNKRNVAISVTANTQLVIAPPTGTVHICHLFLLSTSAETYSLVGGTGSTCGTGVEAIIGSTTAANGPSYAANGGQTDGNGMGSVAMSNVPGNNVCILISGSTLIAGNLVWAY